MVRFGWLSSLCLQKRHFDTAERSAGTRFHHFPIAAVTLVR